MQTSTIVIVVLVLATIAVAAFMVHARSRAQSELPSVKLARQIAEGEIAYVEPDPFEARRDYPPPEILEEWANEHQDLEVARVIWMQAEERYREAGIEAVSPVEQKIMIAMSLYNDVNNGGMDMWLGGAPPELLRVSCAALREIGAPHMAQYVEQWLRQVDPAIFETEGLTDARRDCIPEVDEVADAKAFVALEPAFLDAVARYADQNWRAVPRSTV